MEKIGKNAGNDVKAEELLREKGWKIVKIWECELKGKEFSTYLETVTAFLR